jgi:hypothetical protein
MKIDSFHLQCPKCLINTPSNRKVVDGDMLQHSLGVDDVESTESNACRWLEASISSSNSLRYVWQLAESDLLERVHADCVLLLKCSTVELQR